MNIKLAFLAIPLLFVAGCGEAAKEKPAATAPPPAAVKPPTLISLSPPGTVAGQKFNVQPDGSSALGMGVKDTTKDAVVVFGTTVLQAVHGPDAMSTTVPAELFSKPATIPVFIRDSTGESNRIDFVVKPK